jgi:hypothetical protein
MKSLTLIVTGTRQKLTEQQLDTMSSKFEELDSAYDEVLVVTGDAEGVDKFAMQLACAFGWTWRGLKANWESYGKRGGPLRNEQIVQTAIEHCYYRSHSDDEVDILCLAFPAVNSIGTWDCVRAARRRDIEVEVVRDGFQ